TAILSCSDTSKAPSDILGSSQETGAVTSVVYFPSDSAKLAAALENAADAANSASMSSVVATSGQSSAVLSSSAPSSSVRMSSVTLVPTYSVFPVPFAPEATPVNSLNRQDDAI